ncbi:hypothetical protein IID23_02790 [Patescibacteria group bacterium]|nr:hypothetical protein [Patescibacteria group bacterium]
MKKKYLVTVGIVTSLFFSTIIQFLAITGKDKGFPIRYVLNKNEEVPKLGQYYGHPGTEIVQILNIIILAVFIFSLLAFFYWSVKKHPKLLILSVIIGLVYHGTFLLGSLVSGFGDVSSFTVGLLYVVNFPTTFVVNFLATAISGREIDLIIVTAFLNGMLHTAIAYWIIFKLKERRVS